MAAHAVAVALLTAFKVRRHVQPLPNRINAACRAGNYGPMGEEIGALGASGVMGAVGTRSATPNA